jgi:putative membrane protein
VGGVMLYGNGMGGWGMFLMTLSTLMFWGLVIAGVVALVRYAGRTGWTRATSGDEATPERLLAQRFARGEIDEDEYRRRLRVLTGAARTG